MCPPWAHLGGTQAAKRRRQSGWVAGSVAVLASDPAAGPEGAESSTAREISAGVSKTAAGAAGPPRGVPWPAPIEPQPDSPPDVVDGAAGRGTCIGAGGARGAVSEDGATAPAVAPAPAGPVVGSERCVEEPADSGVAGD
jgi:hypothetical protein